MKKLISILAMIAVIFAISCKAPKTNTDSNNSTRTPVVSDIDQIVADLGPLTKGLNYMSETDSDVKPWRAYRVADPLTASNFLRAINKPPLTSVEVRTIESAFSTPINHYPDGYRWQDLQDYLQTNLQDVKEFKVGTVQVDIYAVGLKDGIPVGVYIYAVET